MRRWLAAAGLALTLGCASAPSDFMTAGTWRATEQTGIARLRYLARTDAIEDAWAYVPQQQLWHRISAYRTARGLLISWPILLELCRDNPEIHLYHYHPLRTGLAYAQELHRSGTEEILWWRTYDGMARPHPSRTDLFAAIETHHRCDHERPGVRVEQAVVSAVGAPTMRFGKPSERDVRTHVVRYRIDDDKATSLLGRLNASPPQYLHLEVEELVNITNWPYDAIFENSVLFGKTRADVLREASDATPFTFWEDP